MTDPATTSIPALPAFNPPNRIPIAPMSMQKILTRTIRNHSKSGNLKNFAVKGPDKMGGKRGSSRTGRGTTKTVRAGRTGGSTASPGPRK